MLALPATPSQVLAQAVVPGLSRLLPSKYDSPDARVVLLAIASQESGLRTRVQDGNGPAHGLLQSEQGGIGDVLANPVSAADAKALCSRCAVAPVASDVWWALTTDDAFAFAFARLMLFCDPRPLPEFGDPEGAWQCYLRNWRPGKPRPQDWTSNYAAALAAVQSFNATGDVA